MSTKPIKSHGDRELIQLAKELYCNIEICENCRPADVKRYEQVIAELAERNYKIVQPCIDFEREYHDEKPERNHEFKLSFSAGGHIIQRVYIVNPKEYSPKRILELLNSGKAQTTVQEGGTIDVVSSGETIAHVVDVENNMTYTAFEVHEPLHA